jgi:hypothetical protein
MNAIYYECVNERKKISKKVVEVEPTTMCLLVHCSTIFTNTVSFCDQTNFYIKSKPFPVLTKQLQNVEGSKGTLVLWITSLLLYHLSHSDCVQMEKLLKF